LALTLLRNVAVALPDLVSPREEDETQLLKDIRVRDVEMVFQEWNWDVTSKIFLHVILTSCHCALTELKPILRRYWVYSPLCEIYPSRELLLLLLGRRRRSTRAREVLVAGCPVLTSKERLSWVALARILGIECLLVLTLGRGLRGRACKSLVSVRRDWC